MASQKMVTVTKTCTTRKTPSSTGKVHSEVKKGFEFAFVGQVTNKDKKTNDSKVKEDKADEKEKTKRAGRPRRTA